MFVLIGLIAISGALFPRMFPSWGSYDNPSNSNPSNSIEPTQSKANEPDLQLLYVKYYHVDHVLVLGLENVGLLRVRDIEFLHHYFGISEA
ncbi:MAG: hypothetical protein ACTSW1_01090 [Candidatus Hodarchaeales archaeon]